MSNFQAILNKLYSKDNGVFAILKTQNKVELAAIDDLENAISELEPLVQTQYQDAEQDSKELILMYQDFKNSAEQYYDKYSDMENYYSDYKTINKALYEKLMSYKDLSDELGIDPLSSDTFKYGDELLQETNAELAKVYQIEDVTQAALNITNRIE